MFTNRTIIAITALGLALGAQAQQTQRLSGHEHTQVQYTEQRVSLPGDTMSIDSLVEVRTLEVRKFIDTLQFVTPREDTVILPIDSAQRKGHYVEFHLGAGFGNAGYGLIRKDLTHPTATGYEQGSVSGVVQLQYAYFFHPNVGVGVGAWLSNYSSQGYLSGDFAYPDQYDSDDLGGTAQPEQYTHHATVTGWHERQTIHTVGLPVSLQFQAWGKQNKAGFFAALGAAPAYTVKSDYRVLQGKVEHWGKYDHRGGAEIHNAHEFMTIDYAGRTAKQQVKAFSATALVDLGLLVRLSTQVDLLIGLYGHYTFLDMQNATLTDLGWKDDRFPNLDVAEYNGILASNCIAGADGKGQLHPWQAGLKLGIHWHSLEKPRKEITHFNDTTLQMVERFDSTWVTRIDTLQRKHIQSRELVQRTINKLNRIYFDFNSAELADDSKQALDEIAYYLRSMPNKIILGGHASKDGSRKHNEKLALDRALAVKKYLVSQGVSAKRMTVKDYGATVANAINLSDDLSLDRRVEIIIQDK